MSSGLGAVTCDDFCESNVSSSIRVLNNHNDLFNPSLRNEPVAYAIREVGQHFYTAPVLYQKALADPMGLWIAINSRLRSAQNSRIAVARAFPNWLKTMIVLSEKKLGLKTCHIASFAALSSPKSITRMPISCFSHLMSGRSNLSLSVFKALRCTSRRSW